MVQSNAFILWFHWLRESIWWAQTEGLIVKHLKHPNSTTFNCMSEFFYSNITVLNKITSQTLFPAYSSKEGDESSPKSLKIEFSIHFILLFWNLGFMLIEVREKLTQLVSSSAAQEECYLFLISKPGSEANWFRGRTWHQCKEQSQTYSAFCNTCFVSSSSTFWGESIMRTISFDLNKRIKKSEFLVLQAVRKCLKM